MLCKSTAERIHVKGNATVKIQELELTFTAYEMYHVMTVLTVVLVEWSQYDFVVKVNVVYSR